MQVDVDEIIAVIEKRRAFNKLNMADIQFVRDGNTTTVDPAFIYKFESIGLNNTDLVQILFIDPSHVSQP